MWRVLCISMVLSLTLGACDGGEPMEAPDQGVEPVFVFGGLICSPQRACDGPCCPQMIEWLQCQLECLGDALASEDPDEIERCTWACVDALGDSACGALLETIAECAVCGSGDDCDATACCAVVHEAF